METTAGKFEQVNDGLQSMLSKLLNELGALQGSWEGSGARSFENVKVAYEANQKKLGEALRETATAIRTAGKDYTAADEESGSRVNNINTSVNLPL